MNTSQRTVLVVAIGLALAVVAGALNTPGINPNGGWFNYAPNAGPIYAPDTSYGVWRDTLVWLTAIAIWAGAALLIFRHPRKAPPRPVDPKTERTQ